MDAHTKRGLIGMALIACALIALNMGNASAESFGYYPAYSYFSYSPSYGYYPGYYGNYYVGAYDGYYGGYNSYSPAYYGSYGYYPTIYDYGYDPEYYNGYAGDHYGYYNTPYQSKYYLSLSDYEPSYGYYDSGDYEPSYKYYSKHYCHNKDDCEDEFDDWLDEGGGMNENYARYAARQWIGNNFYGRYADVSGLTTEEAFGGATTPEQSWSNWRNKEAYDYRDLGYNDQGPSYYEPVYDSNLGYYNWRY
jgi:hypothetical protein